MATLWRTVAFYRLTQHERDNHRFLSNDQVKENFRNILKSEYEIQNNGHWVFRLTIDGRDVFIEVVEFNNNKSYAKITIGYGNPHGTVALRDVNSCETSEIEMDENQQVETYTYCYIDFKTCFVSYIRSKTAPTVRVLENMLNQVLTKYVSSCDAILTKEVIQELQGKRISKIWVTVARPSNDILSAELGVGRKNFANLQAIKKVSQTYTIIANRGQTLLDPNFSYENFVDEISNIYGKDLEAIKFTVAGENGDRARVYDILQNFITVGRRLEINGSASVTKNDIFNELIACYDKEKESLQSCVSEN
jgi:hypothetical protein